MTLGAHSVGAHPASDLATIKRAASVHVVGQTVTIAATTLYTAPASRLYLVLAEILCTAAGGADRTVTLTVRNTDDVGATSSATAAFTVGATGRVTATWMLQAKYGTAITYETAVAGAAGVAGTYAIYLTVLEVLP